MLIALLTSTHPVNQLTDYDRSIQNGSLHTIVPGALLLCDAPHASVWSGQQWMDDGPRRRFSAEFYACLLSEMGVRLALRFDDESDNDVATSNAATFAAHGIRVITLADLSPGAAEGNGSAQGCAKAGLGPQAFAAFAALAGEAGGPAALLCRDSAAERGRACVLAAAWITARHGLFPSPDAAAAWACLASGGMAAPPEDDMAALRAAWACRWATMPTTPTPPRSPGALRRSPRLQPAQRASLDGAVSRWRTDAARAGPGFSQSVPDLRSASRSSAAAPPLESPGRRRSARSAAQPAAAGPRPARAFRVSAADGPPLPPMSPPSPRAAPGAALKAASAPYARPGQPSLQQPAGRVYRLFRPAFAGLAVLAVALLLFQLFLCPGHLRSRFPHA